MNLVDNLLEDGSVQLQVKVADWREAIECGAGLLLAKGAVTDSYIEAIIKNTEELGPYYILDEGVAMPHARPEKGALKTAFSLITLSEPVQFGDKDDDMVSVLISFSATDAEAHNQQALLQIAELVENEEAMAELKLATDMDSAQTILKTVFH